MSRQRTFRLFGVVVILALLAVVSMRIYSRKGAAPAVQGPQHRATEDATTRGAASEREVGARTSPGEPEQGGCLTIRIVGAPNAINPVISTANVEFQVENLVFDGFINISPDMNPVPSEAGTVTPSEDHKVYTIRLSPEGKWQDGRPVTADDVLFFYEMIQDPKNGAQAQQDNFAVIDHVQKIDALTVKVYLKEPVPTGMWKASLGLMPRHAVQAEMEEFKREGKVWDIRSSKLNRYPIGNGSYRLVDWEQPDTLILERWEEYPFTKPYLKRIIFKVIPEETAALNAVRAGEIDCIPQMSAWAFSEGTGDAPFTDMCRKMKSPTLNYTSILWNMNGSNPFFEDRRVRRALAMSVDLQTIIRTLGKDLSVRANGPWSPSLWCHDPGVKPLAYDPGAAMALLDQAGWKDVDGDGIREKDGIPFAFDLLAFQDRTVIDILTAATDYMKKVGVRPTLRPLEAATYIERLQESDFQAAYLAWTVGVDPDYQYNVWHSSQYGRGRNFADYRNAQVDALFEEGRRTFDPAERKRIYQKIQRILYEDQACFFLYYLPHRFAIHRRFNGVTLSAFDPFLTYPGVFSWWVPKREQKCR
jgi:peptide/nickel transport system substrate-binding protein